MCIFFFRHKFLPLGVFLQRLLLVTKGYFARTPFSSSCFMPRVPRTRCWGLYGLNHCIISLTLYFFLNGTHWPSRFTFVSKINIFYFTFTSGFRRHSKRRRRNQKKVISIVPFLHRVRCEGIYVNECMFTWCVVSGFMN